MPPGCRAATCRRRRTGRPRLLSTSAQSEYATRLRMRACRLDNFSLHPLFTVMGPSRKGQAFGLLLSHSWRLHMKLRAQGRGCWGCAEGGRCANRVLLEELAKVSAPEQQAVLAKQLADVTPAVRFCQYQLSRAGTARPGPASEVAEPQPESDALQVMLVSSLVAGHGAAACIVLHMCALS